MRDHLKFDLPDEYNEKRFIGKLADPYATAKEPAVVERFTFYDTFDWRLFNKSLVLYESGDRLFLRKLDKTDINHSARISSPPVFIQDFPAGELKKQLAAIIKMRALLKLVEVQARSRLYRILNRNEKTVARLVFEEIRPPGNRSTPALANHLWLKPVKGYPKYVRHLVKHFQAAGLIVSKKQDIFFKALELVDKKPGSYSAKVNIQLEPDMRSDTATKIILRFLLHVMRINAAQIEKDLDTEFLHDLRVAIRRTRVALGQIKNVFPAKTTNRFKKNFASVGKLSNELRDLDVYLLNEDRYKALLPPVLREEIDPLFEYLREKRSKALQRVIRGLKAKRNVKILQDWEAFLNKPLRDSATAHRAGLPVIDLACERIHQKYRNVVKAGNLILKKTEDERLHALRIECKKLRYLMEFFASLFLRKKNDILIAQLKKLQDNLGDFNDLSIQKESLLNISTQIPASQHQTQKILLAIGSLIGELEKERQIVKNAFAKTFTNFASPENQALFRQLFADEEKH